MRVGMFGENLIERLVLSGGKAAVPLVETFFATAAARAIMAGAKLGVFGALASGPRTSAEVAEAVGADPKAAEKLLRALAAGRYLAFRNGTYRLTPMARRWLLPGGRGSLHDSVMFSYFEWSAMGHYEEYIKTGRPIGSHGAAEEGLWESYQLGMRSRSALWAEEAVRRTPVPRSPDAMIDIGGAHGHLAACFCRRYPGLSATVLDLEPAVRQSEALLREEGMGDRLRHLVGDARTADLGAESYDVVFAAHLVHHFDEASNMDLMRRAAKALRPGGTAAVFDLERPSGAGSGGQFGALMDLYFAVVSDSGTWSAEEMAGWMSAAGLRPCRPSRFRTAPGCVLQAARKPA